MIRHRISTLHTTFLGALSITALFISFACGGGGSSTQVPAPQDKSISVTLSGNGAGSVASTDGEINCGKSCSNSYPVGSVITLNATPASGSTFAGWSVGCSGTAATCTVTVASGSAVTAQFQLVNYTLTVAHSGTGVGTVTSSDGAVNCGTACSAACTSGGSVTLTAVAAPGSNFAGWSGGGCSGTAPTCTVNMGAAEAVTAQFTLQNYTLTVARNGTGSGSVTSSDGTINCGTTCSAAYANGTSVVLTAVAASGSAFTGWSGGGCSGTASQCSVSVTAVSTVTATFTVIPSYALTVSNLASGAGIVTSSDGQINCGSSCSGGYISGTSVTLTASPNSVSNFGGWSGGNCIGTVSTCTVDVSAAVTVTATFSSFGGEIAAWGDSLTYGNQDGTGTTYPSVLAQLTTRSVYNGGVSGESSTQIAARMLDDTSRYGDLTIIWAGRNNSEDESAVLGDIASMVAVLPEPKHFLVLSILNACYEGNIESTAYSQIIALNQALQAAYPNNYLDIRSLLVAQYDPSSPEDVFDHSIDVPPTSLRFDNLHLNAAGYTFVAGQISRAIY